MDSPFYDRQAVIGSSITNHRSQIALALARRLKVRTVLDVGCGDGKVSELLAGATHARVTCVDVSETAIQSCRNRGLEAHRVNIGHARLPFADATFDLVFMTEVVEHLVRPDRALEEIRRVLVPGGKLIMSTPNLACLPNRILLALGVQPLFTEVSEDVVLGRRLRRLGQGGVPVGHLRLYTRRALLEFLTLRGFVVERLQGAAFHSAGVLGRTERAIGAFPSVAMIFVLLAHTSLAPVGIRSADDH